MSAISLRAMTATLPASRCRTTLLKSDESSVPVSDAGGAPADVFRATDQYTVQGDAFSRAIREKSQVPVPLEDSLKNMAVIEAVLRAGESRQWEDVRV